MDYLLMILGSFILGSIPNGLFVGRITHGVDLRAYGSKNIGATNAFRVLGPWPALIVLITDMAKGILGVYLGLWLIGTPIAQLVGGIAAMAGHNWSIFLGFKGGRGVATGLGVISVLVPKVTAIVFLVWLVLVLATRYVSLASIVAAVIVPIAMWKLGEIPEFIFFGIVAALFVVVRHKPNIQRLMNGTESKIKAYSASDEIKKGK